MSKLDLSEVWTNLFWFLKLAKIDKKFKTVWESCAGEKPFSWVAKAHESVQICSLARFNSTLAFLILHNCAEFFAEQIQQLQGQGAMHPDSAHFGASLPYQLPHAVREVVSLRNHNLCNIPKGSRKEK